MANGGSENTEMKAENFSYGWSDTNAAESHDVIMPMVLRILEQERPAPASLVDLGCGNGYAASVLARRGYAVVGLDASGDGVNLAAKSFPGVEFGVSSVYDPCPPGRLGKFDVVLSTEVIEHLYYPRELFRRAHEMLRPGGLLIVSTPYHGYVKNMALSILNGWDRHFTADWDGGHIKFFSPTTLAKMALEAGFGNLKFRNVGRVPYLWKSMILVGRKGI